MIAIPQPNGSVRTNGHTDSAKIRHSASHPCPVCGGQEDDARRNGKRCFGFTVHGWCHCTREEYAGNAKFHAGSSTYSHILQGPCLCGKEHGATVTALTRTNGKAKRKRLPRVYPTLDAAGDAAGKHVATESKSSVVSRRFSIYQNLDSTAHMAVARYDLENGKKSYRPFHPSGAGWSLGDPSGKLPLYKAPVLASAMRVFFFEGEKCADIGCRLGLVCTTTAHGAMSPHKSDLSQLAGATKSSLCATMMPMVKSTRPRSANCWTSLSLVLQLNCCGYSWKIRVTT